MLYFICKYRIFFWDMQEYIAIFSLAKPPRARSVPINSLCMIFVVFAALREYIRSICEIRWNLYWLLPRVEAAIGGGHCKQCCLFNEGHDASLHERHEFYDFRERKVRCFFARKARWFFVRMARISRFFMRKISCHRLADIVLFVPFVL